MGMHQVLYTIQFLQDLLHHKHFSHILQHLCIPMILCIYDFHTNFQILLHHNRVRVVWLLDNPSNCLLQFLHFYHQVCQEMILLQHFIKTYDDYHKLVINYDDGDNDVYDQKLMSLIMQKLQLIFSSLIINYFNFIFFYL